MNTEYELGVKLAMVELGLEKDAGLADFLTSWHAAETLSPGFWRGLGKSYGGEGRSLRKAIGDLAIRVPEDIKDVAGAASRELPNVIRRPLENAVGSVSDFIGDGAYRSYGDLIAKLTGVR